MLPFSTVERAQRISNCGPKRGRITFVLYNVALFGLARGEVDVCLWNEMELDFREGSQVRKLVRKPSLERYTLFQFNHIGESFAF